MAHFRESVSPVSKNASFVIFIEGAVKNIDDYLLHLGYIRFYHTKAKQMFIFCININRNFSVRDFLTLQFLKLFFSNSSTFLII